MIIPPPRVSICLPVYNGEKYVREAIGSILNQTFEDFELIISDNASTDGTGDICCEAASQDSRVRYFRSDLNRGLAWNHNRTFELARGSYVMWIGHDDILAKDYVRRCFEVLEQDAGAVLCFAKTVYIDDQGTVVTKTEFDNVGASHSPSERLACIIRPNYKCEAIFGLMRKEVLKQTRLHRGFAGSDHVLLAEMALKGRFSMIPDFLFFRREYALQTTKRVWDPRERTLIFDPSKAGKVILPNVDRASGFCSAINRARLPWAERVRCFKHVAKWLWVHRLYLRRDFVLELDSSMQRYLSENQVKRLLSIKRRLFKRSLTEL
jgi:glycosyltransferase involved in cell wall biosynthesis